MTATKAERRKRAMDRFKPPCTIDVAVGDTVFYDLKNANQAYLIVRVTAVTPRRVVVVQVDGEDRPVGGHRSVVPASLVKTIPATATVVS